jgi:hypothetical protein
MLGGVAEEAACPELQADLDELPARAPRGCWPLRCKPRSTTTWLPTLAR